MTRLTVATLALLLATSAFAQRDNVLQEPDRTVYRKKTDLDFGASPVEGEIKKPINSYIYVKGKTVFGSQMKVRGDFVPELQKSVDSL
jgi:hypothetical protein